MTLLELARRAAGLTQQELAKRAATDQALISRLEQSGARSRRPSYETIVRIARALNLAPDQLFPVPPVSKGGRSKADEARS